MDEKLRVCVSNIPAAQISDCVTTLSEVTFDGESACRAAQYDEETVRAVFYGTPSCRKELRQLLKEKLFQVFGKNTLQISVVPVDRRQKPLSELQVPAGISTAMDAIETRDQASGQFAHNI